MSGKGEPYTCAYCKGVFDKGWTDEEALAELADEFAVSVECCDVVCDDCYKRMGFGGADEQPQPATAGKGGGGHREGSPVAPAKEPHSAAVAGRLDRLLRLDRRRRLGAALAGTHEDRWRYALDRQLRAIQGELLAFGTAIYDRHKAAERIVRNYHRLEAIAAAKEALR